MSHPTPSAGRRPPARPSPTPLPAPHRSQLSPTALAQSARSCPLPHTCPRGPLHACAQQNVQPTCTFVHAMHATGLRVCTERGHAASSNGCTAVPQPHTCAGSSAHMGAVCAPWLQAVHTGPPRPPPRCLALFHSRRSSAACRGGDITGDAQPGAQRPARSQGMATHLLRIGRPVLVLGWGPACSCHPRGRSAAPGTHNAPTGSPGLAACPCTGAAARSTALCPPHHSSWGAPSGVFQPSSSGEGDVGGEGGGSRRSPGCRWGVGARGQRRCVTVFMRTSRSARDVRMALPAAALPGGTVPPRSPRRS